MPKFVSIICISFDEVIKKANSLFVSCMAIQLVIAIMAAEGTSIRET